MVAEASAAAVVTVPLEIDATDEVFGAVPAAAVAEAIGIRRSTLAAWRRRGFGPPSMRLGRLLTVYPLADLHGWWTTPAASRLRRRRECLRAT